MSDDDNENTSTDFAREIVPINLEDEMRDSYLTTGTSLTANRRVLSVT